MWILALVALACETPSTEQSADLTVPVTVQPVGLGTIEEVVTSTGTLRPLQEAVVITETRGYLSLPEIDGRKPREGLQVTAGQVVARLENQLSMTIINPAMAKPAKARSAAHSGAFTASG